MVSAVPPPAPSGPAPSFQERLAALSHEWRAQLPTRLDTLQVLFRSCRQSPGDDQDLQELYRQAHMLAGSAGTFGLHALGEHARALDMELQQVMARGGRAAADFDPAGRLLDALLAAPRE
ncbi:Hpt domain-containing protein [Ramlibacter sp. MMS24-I3-19]|uniref:Hpt domain-containing protein n=1 Tax=Ramlibacter sp. MMS24-I3-19 TaxID=3416606 RepID=UPI003CFF6E96